jgi:hypothetical protein
MSNFHFLFLILENFQIKCRVFSSDIPDCAHTATWCLIDYAAELAYADFLVTRMASNGSPDGILKGVVSRGTSNEPEKGANNGLKIETKKPLQVVIVCHST